MWDADDHRELTSLRQKASIMELTSTVDPLVPHSSQLKKTSQVKDTQGCRS